MIQTRSRSVKPKLQCVLARKAKKPSLSGQIDQQSNTKRRTKFIWKNTRSQVPTSADKNVKLKVLGGQGSPVGLCGQ